MDSKKLTYVLLPVAAIVWGLISYKIYANLNPEDEPVEIGVQMELPKFDQGKVELFELGLKYKDPFLKNRPVTEEYNFGGQDPAAVAKPRTNVQQLPKEVLPKLKPWPAVVFKGVIENLSDKNPIAILNVANRSHLIKVGDEAGEVTLKAIYATDSVLVVFQKEEKIVSR